MSEHIGHIDMDWDFGKALREQIHREDEVGWAARDLLKQDESVMRKEVKSERWPAGLVKTFISKILP